jgi:hypothetical protein
MSLERFSKKMINFKRPSVISREERIVTSILENLQEGEPMILLTEREKTHGKYRETAALSQSIKDVLKSGRNWNNMNDQQRESFEQIAGKLARILNGNQNWRDHWDDVAGYAKLGGDHSPTDLTVVTNDIQEAS